MSNRLAAFLPTLNLFSSLQKVGKALMLPVAVLPVAGLLLGIGSSHFAILPDQVSNIMKASGEVIFGSLPLIFAIDYVIEGPAMMAPAMAGLRSQAPSSPPPT